MRFHDNLSRIKRHPAWTALVVVVAAGGLTAWAAAPADRPELSKEQRRALRDLRDQLDESGARPEVCRAAHDSLWASWGLEPPARGPHGPGGGRGWKGKLSADQRAELRALRDRHDAQDATPEVRRAERDQLLASWGMEAPAGGQGRGRGPCGHGGPRGRMGKLSADQKDELRALEDKLDDQDASPGERREAVDSLLKGWGIEPPAGGMGLGPCGPGGPGGPHGRFGKLSAAQRKELRALEDKLEDQDATPEERRQAVDSLLKGWGIEPPEGGRGLGPCGPGGPGGPHGRFGKLSAAQRKELRALEDKLEDQDASPGERREAVDSLLKGWGVEPPACPGPALDEEESSLPAALETATASGTEAQPAGTLLNGNTPNPFNPETVIRFELPESGAVTLAVYDMAGGRVRTLAQGTLSSGPHEVAWNGMDAQGRPAASGTYLYRLEAAGRTETGRMTLLR